MRANYLCFEAANEEPDNFLTDADFTRRIRGCAQARSESANAVAKAARAKCNLRRNPGRLQSRAGAPLPERELPVSEIAWLPGYQELSSFTRAFKRWTGSTP
jgi:AraC-like DNA-binding protein